jgi:beta-galactosidase
MLVMDENRNFGSSPEYLRQLDWLVRRDRNHPSVILWSVFNEETVAGHRDGLRNGPPHERGGQSSRHHAARHRGPKQFHAEPINASQAADVAGFNYVYRDFDRYHAAQPHQADLQFGRYRVGDDAR